MQEVCVTLKWLRYDWRFISDLSLSILVKGPTPSSTAYGIALSLLPTFAASFISRLRTAADLLESTIFVLSTGLCSSKSSANKGLSRYSTLEISSARPYVKLFNSFIMLIFPCTRITLKPAACVANLPPPLPSSTSTVFPLR